MSYRPMGFEVDYSLNKMDRPNDRIDDDNFRRGWEASVDALLEALRKQGHRVNAWSSPTFEKGGLAVEVSGIWVFIPD